VKVKYQTLIIITGAFSKRERLNLRIKLEVSLVYVSFVCMFGFHRQMYEMHNKILSQY